MSDKDRRFIGKIYPIKKPPLFEAAFEVIG
jgi:hypothetical protein